MDKRIIDFNQVNEIAQKGIRRAAAFLGLGVNVARDSGFNKYQLSELVNLRIIPDNISDDEIDHLKREFEKWIIVNGLRELVESFAIYLDRIHTSCLLMANSKKTISEDDANKFQIAFEKKGVEKKLATIKNRFEIKTDKENYLVSINKARNCITHRNGRVGFEDVDKNNFFELKWWAFDIYIETPDGEKYPMTPPYPMEGIFLKDGGTLNLKVTDRVVEYKLGQCISFTPNDLSEICLLFHLATGEILNSAINFAEGIGIEVRKT